MNNIYATEFEEQCALIKYLDIKEYKYSAIPNSTYTKSWKQKSKNKASGLRAGLPDLFIIANNIPMFIELKRVKGGVVSQVQREWIDAISSANIPVEVCRGCNEAIEFIERVIQINKSYKLKDD